MKTPFLKAFAFLSALVSLGLPKVYTQQILYPVNCGFELPDLSSSNAAYKYSGQFSNTELTAFGWSFESTTTAGVSLKGSPFMAVNIANQNTDSLRSSAGQAAFIQGCGSLSQYVTNVPGGSAVISCCVEARATDHAIHAVQILLDGTVVCSYTASTQGVFEKCSGSPVPIADGSSHTISFTGTDTTGSCTNFIDGVRIEVTSGSGAKTSTKFFYPLNNGFEAPDLGLTPATAYKYYTSSTSGPGTGLGWVFSAPDGSGCGIAANGSYFNLVGAVNPNVRGVENPAGGQALFVTGPGIVSQNIAGFVTGNAVITCGLEGKSAESGYNLVTVQVDDKMVGTLTPSARDSFQTFATPPFTVSAGTHEIKLSGSASTPTLTTFIDNVAIFNSPVAGVTTVSTVQTTSDGKNYLEVDKLPFNYLAVQNNGTTQFQHLTNPTSQSLPWLENMFTATQAAGYSVIGQRLNWGDIEPTTRGNFDWTVIDCYVNWANLHGLKLDLVWFGSICGGGALSDVSPFPISGGYTRQLPDYVNSTSKYFSHGLISGQTQAPDLPSKGLDATNLYLWEQNAVTNLFNHLQATDINHCVVLFQVYNEPNLYPDWAAPEFQTSVLDQLGAAVKRSTYVVATRVNLAIPDPTEPIDSTYPWTSGGVNVGALPHIDFVGLDPYTAIPDTIATAITSAKGNSKLAYIAENSGSVPYMSHLLANVIVNGGFYETWELTNQSIAQGIYADANEDNWGTQPGTLRDSSLSVKRLLSALKKISSIVTLAPANKMAGFNLHWLANDSEWEPVGTASVKFSTPPGDSSVAIGIQSGGYIYVVSDTAGTVTFSTVTQPPLVSVGCVDSNNKWQQKSTRTPVLDSNGTYTFTYQGVVNPGDDVANDCIRFQLP